VGAEGEAGDPGSGGVPGLVRVGAWTARRVELRPWKAGPGRHAARAVPIPGHAAWI